MDKDIIEEIKIELFENMGTYIIDNNNYDDYDNWASKPELDLEAIYKLLDEKLKNNS